MEQIITIDKYLEEVEHRGYVRGRNIAAAQDIPPLGSMARLADETTEREVDSIEKQKEIMTSWAFASESANRDFSPFEFTAHEFNQRDDADDVWERFGAGIDRGITDEIEARFYKEA